SAPLASTVAWDARSSSASRGTARVTTTIGFAISPSEAWKHMRTDIDTSIFKSYDIRGIVPAQLNDDIAYAIGRAFVEVLDRKNICIGRDMRPSGEAFMAAVSRGA